MGANIKIMKREILSITEAFSMQPYSVYIKGGGHLVKGYGLQVDKLVKDYKIVNDQEVSVIRGYIGTDLACEYLETSVNIHYVV